MNVNGWWKRAQEKWENFSKRTERRESVKGKGRKGDGGGGEIGTEQADVRLFFYCRVDECNEQNLRHEVPVKTRSHPRSYRCMRIGVLILENLEMHVTSSSGPLAVPNVISALRSSGVSRTKQ